MTENQTVQPSNWIVYTALLLGFPLLMIIYLFFAVTILSKYIVQMFKK